jgi:hypothetical protein
MINRTYNKLEEDTHTHSHNHTHTYIHTYTHTHTHTHTHTLTKGTSWTFSSDGLAYKNFTHHIKYKYRMFHLKSNTNTHEPLHTQTDETCENIELLRPYTVVAADALLGISTAVSSAVLLLDKHLSQTLPMSQFLFY